MRSLTRPLAAVPLALTLLASTSVAQDAAASSQPRKFNTQVIGLRNWTAEQVNDSLVKKFGPSEGLDSHACGANLHRIGFPRTSAIYFQSKDGSAKTVVALVEPADSNRVGALKIPPVSKPLPAEWAAALKPFVDTSGKWILSNQLSGMIQLYPMYARGQVDSARAFMPRFRAKPEHEVLWAFMKSQSNEKGKAIALSVLSGDSSYIHRTFVLSVLSTFGADDKMWGTMLHTVRDPNENVGMQATNILSRWTAERPHKVDWSNNAEDVRAVFAGTNLWAILDLMRVMIATELSPSLAKAVLADNGTYLLGYASLEGIPAGSGLARKLLTQLSGQDYGDDVGKWKTWVATL